jgi:hypothetical protein
LVGLYEEPERPANAVDYIKRYMGAPAGVDVEALLLEVEQLKAENAKLRSTVEQLNSKVSLIIALCLFSFFIVCFQRFFHFLSYRPKLPLTLDLLWSLFQNNFIFVGFPFSLQKNKRERAILK